MKIYGSVLLMCKWKKLIESLTSKAKGIRISVNLSTTFQILANTSREKCCLINVLCEHPFLHHSRKIDTSEQSLLSVYTLKASALLELLNFFQIICSSCIVC